MAKSKGMAPDKKGYSEGSFGHGGHHRKEMKSMPAATADHMVNQPMSTPTNGSNDE